MERKYKADELEYLIDREAYSYLYKKEMVIENERMETLIDELKSRGFKEEEGLLPKELSSETVIVMFPKDKPEKDHAEMEIMEVLVYSNDRETYFKVKVPEGVTEIINCTELRTRMMSINGGFGVWIRNGEMVLDQIEFTKLYLLPEERKANRLFTNKEFEKYLKDKTLPKRLLIEE